MIFSSVHNPNTSLNYSTIQGAIDAPETLDGHTITVDTGTYVENVAVNKRLTLIGEGADVVTVRVADAEDHVFNVTADWVNVSGFAMAGAMSYSHYAGIYLNGADHCNISDNNCSNNYYGICLRSSSDNTLQNNTFIHNGLQVDAVSYGNTVENNTVNDKPLVYLKDMSNFTIRSAGQVILVNCTNITVENLNLSDTSTGITLWGTNDCKIVNNTASNDGYGGISLWHSSNTILQNNTANSNRYHGIYLWSSSNNTLTNNDVSNNRGNYGIGLDWYSSNNTLYHNNLINNTNCNAYDTGTNTWDSGSRGNCWGDYREKYPGAVGIDDIGIWNISYAIPGGTSTDRFPLMQLWTAIAPQKGDLNSDYQITPADAAIALQLAATGAHDDAADVSGDDRVTSLDALMILQAAAGRIEL